MNLKKLQEENAELRKELAYYKSDNYIGRHYIAYLKKLDEMSKMFNENNITEIDLEDKEDRQFERQMKMMERSTLIVKTIDMLEKQVNPLLVKAAEDNFGSDYEEILKQIENG